MDHASVLLQPDDRYVLMRPIQDAKENDGASVDLHKLTAKQLLVAVRAMLYSTAHELGITETELLFVALTTYEEIK